MTRNPPFFFTDNGIDLFGFFMKNWETISNDPYFPSCTAQSLQILIFYLRAKNVWLPKKKPKFQTII